MKKIITALGNERIFELIKKEKELNLINNDIQYKEAIYEILEKASFDFLIIDEKILNNSDVNNEIKKIKNIQKNIKIILLIKNKKLDCKKLLKENNINFIFIEKNINYFYIVKEIKNIIFNNKKNNNKSKIIKNDIYLIDTKNNKINMKKILDNKIILIIIESNLEGIEKGKKVIKKILNNKKIKKDNLHIIVNNYNKFSFDMQIIKKCFYGIDVIGKIKKGRL